MTSERHHTLGRIRTLTAINRGSESCQRVSRGPIAVLLFACVTRIRKEQPLKFRKSEILDFPSKVLFFPDVLAIFFIAFAFAAKSGTAQLQVLLPVWADSKVRFGDFELSINLRRINSVAVVCCCLAHLFTSLRICFASKHRGLWQATCLGER